MSNRDPIKNWGMVSTGFEKGILFPFNVNKKDPIHAKFI
jgi:hypothetical protein